MGAGVSIFKGARKVQNPEILRDASVNYIVLGFALIFESIAWYIAYREFRSKQYGSSHLKCSFFQTVCDSKDPTVFTVLFEDSAAMFGLVVAFAGIWLAEHLNMPFLDGLASVIIGVILAVILAFLAYESKRLLIGKCAATEVVSQIHEIIKQEEGIIAINGILTMHMGPEDILLNLSIDFSDNLTSFEIERSISRLESSIKEKHKQIQRIFIEAQSIADHWRDKDKSKTNN